MQEFKLGDKVWSYKKQQWLKVAHITSSSSYPLEVRTLNNNNIVGIYTSDGRYSNSDKAPDLFYDEVTIVPPPRPLPDIPVDTKMLVWDDGQHKKSKRHFARWENGKCFCCAGGRTSFTTDNKYGTPWDNWEIVE